MYKECIYGFINLFFPATCLACKHVLIYGERYLCTHCLATLPHRSFHLDEGKGNEVVEKFYGKVPVWHATALFVFNKKSDVQALLHEIKYKNQLKLAEVLGAYYGLLLKKVTCHTTCDAIIPVPLHPMRLHDRGYNQSFLFAQGLASSLGLPCYEDWLVRRLDTDTQTKKSRASRWSNVEVAFVLSDRASIEGKYILLVDDLITTGATLTACAKVLFDKGASEVSIATLAVAT